MPSLSYNRARSSRCSRPIDLRSDTVTQPTRPMRAVMAKADVGDDGYGEDPTVNRLQTTAAQLLGKEAALFVPSGTMANQIAIHLHARRGDTVLAEEHAHMLRGDAAKLSALAGVQLQSLGPHGSCAEWAIDPPMNVETHGALAAPVLLAVENTHVASGGSIFPFDQLGGIRVLARQRGLHTHLDGARLFNAAVATRIPVHQWAEPFETVSFCLSKGLGAPVGALLCGDAALMSQARHTRRMLGGGFRQAGMLAAAGLYALEHHVERLAEDHANARFFAAELQRLGFSVLNMPPATNIVLFTVAEPDTCVAAYQEAGVLVRHMGGGVLRAVMHLDVDREDLTRALHILEQHASRT